jgi:hypothetical protein
MKFNYGQMYEYDFDNKYILVECLEDSNYNLKGVVIESSNELYKPGDFSNGWNTVRFLPANSAKTYEDCL